MAPSSKGGCAGLDIGDQLLQRVAATDDHSALGIIGIGLDDRSAIALRDELGSTHRAIKTAMRWTGASERTVKYWIAGERGPSGEHLIALARHSDIIFRMVLMLADRYDGDPPTL